MIQIIIPYFNINKIYLKRFYKKFYFVISFKRFAFNLSFVLSKIASISFVISSFNKKWIYYLYIDFSKKIVGSEIRTLVTTATTLDPNH